MPKTSATRASKGSYCVSGIMAGGGTYSGTIPYFVANSFVQLRTTITNVNWLGFIGGIDVYTYPTSSVHASMVLLPFGLPGSSRTIVGPTYTTGALGRGVPFKLSLDPVSDAVVLAYQVCV